MRLIASHAAGVVHVVYLDDLQVYECSGESAPVTTPRAQVRLSQSTNAASGQIPPSLDAASAR
jgi:hypothetical protein